MINDLHQRLRRNTRVHKALLEPRGHRVFKETKAFKVTKAQRVRRAQKDRKALLGHRDHRVHKESRGILVLRESKVEQVIKVCLVHKVSRVC